MSNQTIAVDLDGVLAEYDGWKGVDHIGQPIEGAREFVSQLQKLGNVVIYTTRCNGGQEDKEKSWKRIWEWLKSYGFDDKVSIWTGDGKPLAAAYIDDRGVTCEPLVIYRGLAYRKAIERAKLLLTEAK